MGRPLRVILADDQQKVRSALKLVLEQTPESCVVGEVADAEALLTQAAVSCPDLVLLDWGLPGLVGGDLLASLRDICPQVQFIALSSQPEARQPALASGIDIFINKAEPPEKLLSAIKDCFLKQGTQGIDNDNVSIFL
jgi:DNA-binding NarL/FixJ family response regulator